MRTAGGRALEPLWLGAEAEAARRVPDATRARLREALARADQKASAGEVLWQGGHAAEGLRLAREAVVVAAESLADLDAAVAARSGAAPATPPAPEDAEAPGAPPSARDVLVRAGAPAARAERTAATLAGLDALVLPEAEADVRPTHAETYRELGAAHRAIARALRRAARSPGEVRAARVARVGAATLLLTALLAYALFQAFRPPYAHAEASDFYANDRRFRAAQVLDGDPDTSWLLSDATEGWVEVRFVPPRDLARVRLLNAKNVGFYDRGTKGYTLVLYRGEQAVLTKRGELGFAREPEWVDVETPVEDVDRVRVRVESWHQLGGGLAELAWTEAPAR